MKNDDVSLRDLTGQQFELKECLDANYAGKPVVVDMWNTWCAPCLNAISQTEEIKHHLADTDLVFLYVSDESSKYNEWKKRAAKIGGEQVRINQDASNALLENFGPPPTCSSTATTDWYMRRPLSPASAATPNSLTRSANNGTLEQTAQSCAPIASETGSLSGIWRILPMTEIQTLNNNYDLLRS